MSRTLATVRSTATTEQIAVVAVDEGGVLVKVQGVTSRIDWGTLRAAATQADSDLRTAYAAVWSEAEEIARVKSPLRVCYGRDSSGVMFHAWVETSWGKFNVGPTWHTLRIRAADEGGSQAREWMAESEARDIAARIAKIAPGHPVQVVRVQS